MELGLGPSLEFFCWPCWAMLRLCCLYLVFVVLWRVFIAGLWSPGGMPLVCDVCCGFVAFPFGILGQVWYLIVSIPDPCCLSYFDKLAFTIEN